MIIVNALLGSGLHELLETYANLRHQYYQPGVLPQQLLPSVNAVSGRITRRGNRINEKLKLILQKQFSSNGAGGAICADIWHDKFKKIDYICVTVHYVDDDFQLTVRIIAHKALDPNKSKTGAYLKTEILAILLKYGIDPYRCKNIVFVTDRGGNLKKALDDFHCQNCGPHFISNTVNESIVPKQPKRAAEVLAICKKIVSEVKNAGKNQQFHPSLKMAIMIRWNSAAAMFESVSLNWDRIVDYLTAANLLHIMNDLVKQELDELLRFLKPFRKASLALQKPLLNI